MNPQKYLQLMSAFDKHLIWCFEQKERGNDEEWNTAKANNLAEYLAEIGIGS